MSAVRPSESFLDRTARALRREVRAPAYRHYKRLWQRVTNGAGRRTHVFVTGAQRSGTNMLMHLLERSPETEVFHEGDPRAFDQYLMRDEGVIQALSRRSPAPFFVIKALCEAERIPHLLDTFGEARCVWLYRDYHGVANSMVRSFASVPDTVQRLAAEGEAAGWWGCGMSAQTQQLLQCLTRRSLDKRSLAALLWYVRNILFFENAMDADPRVVSLRYESLVSEPTLEARRVFEFLGIPFGSRFTSRVHARSVRPDEQPPLDDEVEAVCSTLLGRMNSDVRSAKPLS